MRTQLSLLLAALASPLYAQRHIASKYVTSIDGAQIYAQAAGTKNQPHILLVHGLSLSTAVFDGIFADTSFTSKAYLVGYDTRGHGRSEKPATIEGHASSLYAADYAAVAQEFGLVKPVLVGWSLGGAVASDILEHIIPNPLAGIAYLNAFPALYKVPELATPFVLGLVGGFLAQDNVTLSKTSSVGFVNGLFANPATIPFSTLTSWIGQTTLQTPNQTLFVTRRPQNTTNLSAAGQAGLPVLFLQGRSDRTVNGEKVLAFLRTWFIDITVKWVDYGSHALFYDNQTYVENTLLKFAKRVQ